ncbi:MAG: hypothetical protein DRJ07_17980, partial [Bacteroidetes bacterium]
MKFRYGYREFLPKKLNVTFLKVILFLIFNLSYFCVFAQLKTQKQRFITSNQKALSMLDNIELAYPFSFVVIGDPEA